MPSLVMKTRSLVIIPGIIISVSGIIFHFQGRGMVGPESSFMYSNPDWIDYGIILTIIGLVITGIGIVLSISKRF